MKIRQEDNLILTNSTNEKKFTIQASAKAFQILSSALYSRKIEAIIRELGCNAADSHISAGCPELPFVVHLPNAWEPEFYVEDFGIGLDADDVENIYTSYFTSTKTDNNEETGGFGLGSKTPFSYCDSFNLRARKNGVEYHFNAYINMQGEPATTLLSQTETTERNGVRVSVPVKLTDYNQFRNDASVVYKWFNVVPTIIGGANGELSIDNSKAQRLAKEGSFWSEYSKGGWDKNSITAVMGNVAYHVPKVAETFTKHFNQSERKFFENNSLFIQFKIGDLDVAASRETISFDEDTEEAFVKRVKEVIASFCEVTQIKLDGEITTVQDAISLVNDEVGTWANSMFMYKGKSIHDWSAKNFVTYLRDSIEDIEDYYFARTRRGTVKRHSLDYIGGFTFAKLDSKKIVVLVGNDKGFQTIARQLCNTDSDCYGVFFIDVMPTDAQKADLFEAFGDYLTFQVAADLIIADKARRKAERDRLKALQGPSYRKPTVTRIGRDSLRAARVFDLDSSFNYTFKHNHIVNAEHVKDKAHVLLVERYSSADIVIEHPTRLDSAGSPVSMVLEVATGSEGALQSFCRIFNIDTVIIIKAEMLKKAEAMFPNRVTTIKACNVDYIRAVTLRSSFKILGDGLTASELIKDHVSYGPESLTNVLIERAEAYVAQYPDSPLAKAIAMTASLQSWDSVARIPYLLRDVASDDTFSVKNTVSEIKRTTQSIYDELSNDYPMAFESDIEDGEMLETYLYQMDKLRELGLFKKPVPVVEPEVVNDPVFDVYNDDIPF